MLAILQDETSLSTMIESNPLQLIILTLCGPRTPNRVLWQTVKTQMQCRMMRHFIRVYTFAKTKSTFREINTFWVWKNISFDPSVYTMDYPDITVSNLTENVIDLKMVNSTYTNYTTPLQLAKKLWRNRLYTT